MGMNVLVGCTCRQNLLVPPKSKSKYKFQSIKIVQNASVLGENTLGSMQALLGGKGSVLFKTPNIHTIEE